jgi:hypothetical protein
MLAEHEQLAAYLRVWQDQRLLVLCNLSGEPRAVDLPADAWPTQPKLLLGNWPVAEPDRDTPPTQLRPWEARIYLGCRED